ncbi:MAG: mandelate racemase [Ramlibacter sp.]|nr:mandelate racemase [Ramlibacter sp.]
MAEAPLLAILTIELYERPVKLRMPFRFGVVTLTEAPQAFARVQVALPDGATAWGAAAELMAPKWFDKDLTLTNEDNFDQLRAVLRMARDAYLSDRTPASAFGHFARHHDAHANAAAARGFNPLLASYGPALVDRAVLDALCRARGLSFYAAMQSNLAGLGPAHPQFAALHFDGFLSNLRPAERMHARHTVGLVDAITAADQATRVGDGLPETLEEVVQFYGHRYFKLKVAGKVEADVQRLLAIAAVLDRSPQPYFASLDGNEQYESAEGVQELVRAIQVQPALRRLWDSILFIEQPIARKLALQVDLRAAELGRPVIVDESDGELQSFVQARSHGYAGVSSKTCKGVYKSLLNAARCAAWNREEGGQRYFMSAEDLTTQAGLSVQQDLALVNLLGITHVERNGHHYVNGMDALPQAEQQAFLRAHPDVYEHSHGAVRLRIRDGEIRLGSLDTPRFASGAMPDFGAMRTL